MQCVHGVFIAQLVVQHLVNILTPCGRSANNNRIAVVLADRFNNFFRIGFNLPIPCDVAIRLIADFINNIGTILVFLRNFFKERLRLCGMGGRVAGIEHVPIHHHIHTQINAGINALNHQVIVAVLVLQIAGLTAAPAFLNIHGKPDDVTAPVIPQDLKRSLGNRIGEPADSMRGHPQQLEHVPVLVHDIHPADRKLSVLLHRRAGGRFRCGLLGGRGGFLCGFCCGGLRRSFLCCCHRCIFGIRVLVCISHGCLTFGSAFCSVRIRFRRSGCRESRGFAGGRYRSLLLCAGGSFDCTLILNRHQYHHCRRKNHHRHRRNPFEHAYHSHILFL